MHIRVGYEIAYDCVQLTPMILTLNVHFTRASDLFAPDHMVVTPAVPIRGYRDGFGNWCNRLVAPAGRIQLTANAIIRDTGEPDPYVPNAIQHAVQDLPEETLVFLLGSRYCDTDKLSQIAWDLFGKTPMGWARVQAICDFVHKQITFGYGHARNTRTAFEALNEGRGVCRDYAHLAIAFCRCMNIPARYCTGYLSDIGEQPPFGPPDFAAWMEVYLGGEWHLFDPRNNARRKGRILIARGRDAVDVAISGNFGHCSLASFKVWTDEVP